MLDSRGHRARHSGLGRSAQLAGCAAELTLAPNVASRRNVALEAERMRRGDWPCTLSHRLRGSTLGIFGLGHIGALVAEGGKGLGMKVLVSEARRIPWRRRRDHRLRGGPQQGRPVRARRRAVDQRAAASRDPRALSVPTIWRG